MQDAVLKLVSELATAARNIISGSRDFRIR